MVLAVKSLSVNTPCGGTAVSESIASSGTVTTSISSGGSRILAALSEKVRHESMHIGLVAVGNDPSVCSDQECACDVMCDGSYSRTYYDKSLRASDDA